MNEQDINEAIEKARRAEASGPGWRCVSCGTTVLLKSEKQEGRKPRVSYRRNRDGSYTGICDSCNQPAHAPKHEAAGKTFLTRDQIRNKVMCPKCSAPKGKPCQGRAGDRKTNHQERLWAAKA